MKKKTKMSIKKRIYKILAAVTALILIVGVLWFANGLVGNPISKLIARNAAKEYLKENFRNTDFYLHHVVYDFKFGNYFASVQSPTSQDSTFGIYISNSGKVLGDTYEMVKSGGTTASRLDREYNELTRAVLESKQFPYHCFIKYGTLEIWGDESYERVNPYGIAEYNLGQNELVLDRLYDVRKLGKQVGHLVIYVDSDEVTVENAARIMLDIKRIFDENEVAFRGMDFTLEYPRGEDGTFSDDTIQVNNFLYEDFYEADMIQKVEKADQMVKKMYAERDKEREIELADLQEKTTLNEAVEEG